MSLEWLLENSGAVIRYKTQHELMNVNIKDLYDDLADIIALPQTQKRLTYLKNLDFGRVHGSDHTHLENVLPMLNDFGLNYDIEVYRKVANDKPYLTENITSGSDFFTEQYNKIIALPFLLQSKIPQSGFFDFACARIDCIYNFTKNNDYDIYDEPEKHKRIPKPFRNRPVIKPEIAFGEMCRLPMIYDILTMAEIYKQVPSDIQTKIDNVIDYVLSPEYDVVPFMYGILVAPKHRYYAMGWECKKPFNDNQDYSYRNLHRLLLYSRFPKAVRNPWFQNAVEFLQQYKTKEDTYIFPKEYLPEEDKNWILGSHMSLGENRRKKNWIEVESTFYMQKLLKTIYTLRG